MNTYIEFNKCYLKNKDNKCKNMHIMIQIKWDLNILKLNQILKKRNKKNY